MATEDESAAVSDWDLDEMGDEVGYRIELVDGFDELAGETDYWGCPVIWRWRLRKTTPSLSKRVDCRQRLLGVIPGDGSGVVDVFVVGI